MTKEMKYKTT